ncbi:NPC intracellular cholesterol transporter 2-like [Aricia agestis]|uniref:NPC intracellular cholesterol transporter 2-like n=1 Tax=Aricia agestis TaxID=91739 RepID=UPI001C2021D6|nr:NPC intracellular cholesterol transporter 2-like [Aricia agestis]
MRELALLFVVLAVAAGAKITPAEQCPGEHHDGLRERIQVIPCGRTRCKLRRGTNVTMHFQFKTTREVADLRNTVWGEIAGVALHFPGVDQASVCGNVFSAEDGSPAPCPLEAGREYVYVKQFPVEPYYPETAVRMHWALHDGTSNVICFEAPAVITK